MHKYSVWILCAIVSTLLCGLVYVSSQQILRQSANDPQIQMSEDTANVLATGKPLPASQFSPVIDIAASLSPYIIIYDDQGTPIGSTGLLHGKTPVVPMGILDYTKEHGQNRLTWQPEPGVRSAVVVTLIRGGRGGYVLAGRSLREVERREDQLLFFTACAWIAAMIITGLGFIITIHKRTKR